MEGARACGYTALQTPIVEERTLASLVSLPRYFLCFLLNKLPWNLGFPPSSDIQAAAPAMFGSAACSHVIARSQEVSSAWQRADFLWNCEQS